MSFEFPDAVFLVEFQLLPMAGEGDGFDQVYLLRQVRKNRAVQKFAAVGFGGIADRKQSGEQEGQRS